MKSLKTKKCLVVLLLCMAMMLGLMPNTTNAQEVIATDKKPGLSATSNSSEVVALREENIKHFDMGNGVFQAIAYSHPVHKLDSDGNWQDIDFGLTLTGTRSNRMYANEGAGAAFAEKYVANQPVMTLTKEEHVISMSLLTADKNSVSSRAAIAAVVTNPQNSFQTIEAAQLANFSSKIMYEDVLPGVDLEYIVDPGTVKENIIVNEKAATYQYTFALELTGLYPAMQGDGSIIVYDLETDEPMYEIPAPFMYDAVGNISEEVAYTLNGSGNIYTLTVAANADWINTKGRNFPVTIDPSWIEYTTSGEDTYINQESPNTGYGSNYMMWVSPSRISYVQTPTPSIPENTELSWASLTMFYYFPDGVTSGSVGVAAYRMLSSWNELLLTWNRALNINASMGLDSSVLSASVAFANTGATTSNPAQIAFSITPAVQEWLSGTKQNNGIGLKYVVGSSNQSVIFKSSEASYTYRPRITYQYTNAFEYVNYYDSSMSETQVNNISSAINLANTAFSKQFGITFYANSSPTYKGTLTDACSNGEGNPCTNNCIPSHHKDILWISDQLNSELQQNNERIVFWTDRPRRTYCYHENGTHSLFEALDETVIAAVVNSRRVIHILNLIPDGENSAKDLACMGINLIHETAHTFGMEDNYSAASHSSLGYQCVMERYIQLFAVGFYEDILLGNKDAFCPECKAALSAKISS